MPVTRSDAMSATRTELLGMIRGLLIDHDPAARKQLADVFEELGDTEAAERLRRSAGEYPGIDPEQPAFIRIPVKTIPTVVGALKAAAFADTSAEVERFSRNYTDAEANA